MVTGQTEDNNIVVLTAKGIDFRQTAGQAVCEVEDENAELH